MITSRRGRWLTVVVLLMIGIVGSLWYFSRPSGKSANAASTRPVELNSENEPSIESLSMGEVLDLAIASRKNMAETLDDYQATFVKQEVDTNGVLGELSTVFMKVQTRLRGDREDAPLRVYMRFDSPESTKGREVIWGEDLYDGKMAVHEVGMLLGFKTLWLDPTGMIAMQGQRYPISEVGIVKLTEKLIERGEKDRDNPDISVNIGPSPSTNSPSDRLIQIRRAQPSGLEDDFSLAEITFDSERQLILSYRSFGWTNTENEEPPLLESYTYENLKINVGLTDDDFDPKNPAYNYPAF
ncbi:MAG: DUF1571 domain-containing protein [Planctomycetota bacterium]